MTDQELRVWIAEEAASRGVPEESFVEHILKEAKRAVSRGVIALPNIMGLEESRYLHTALRDLPNFGVCVQIGGGADDGELEEFLDILTSTLREEGVSTDTESRSYSVGVGWSAVAVIITTIGTLVTILAHGQSAADNVRRWTRAFSRLRLGPLTLETLKLICVDDVLSLHDGLELEADLIAAARAVTEDPDTNEHGTVGTAYVVVPVPSLGLSYVFTIAGDGKILHRVTMPYFGPSAPKALSPG